MSVGPDNDMSERPSASILDALAGEGEYVGDGGFTLDPARARAKLRAYALDEPEAYVLLLVEAAWLAGLGGIRSRLSLTHGTTTTATFTSLALDASALDNVIGAVFGSSEGLDGQALARHRTLQTLGLAVNAAAALEPKRLLIEHRDPDGTVLRTVVAGEGADAGVERETVEPDPSPDARPLTSVVLTGSPLDRLRPARERELIHARARYAGFPIECEGERISHGLDGAFGPKHSLVPPPIAVETRDPRRIIGAAILDERRADEPGRLMIVTRGVLSETLEIDALQRGFWAVVEVDLRKDLSQRQVLRDTEFERVVAAARSASDALEWPAPAPAPAPPSEAERDAAAHARTQRRLAWGFGLFGVFGLIFVLYTEFVGAPPPLASGSVWRGQTRCEGRRVTLELRISEDNERRGTLVIDGREGEVGVQRVRISGEHLDASAVNVDFGGWESGPETELEPIDLHGWRGYASVWTYSVGECEPLRLEQR